MLEVLGADGVERALAHLLRNEFCSVSPADLVQEHPLRPGRRCSLPAAPWQQWQRQPRRFVARDESWRSRWLKRKTAESSIAFRSTRVRVRMARSRWPSISGPTR